VLAVAKGINAALMVFYLQFSREMPGSNICLDMSFMTETVSWNFLGPPAQCCNISTI
jgi:hypothetical protein